MAKSTAKKATQTPDVMADVAKFYRVEARGKAGFFKGVIIHKASKKEMVINIPAVSDNAAVMIARSQLVAAVKRGALPLA